VTEPLGRALRELIRFGGAVSDTEFADNHYRVVDGDRLLWSGRSTVWHGAPQRRAATLLRDIARAYPSLRGLKAEYVWTGTAGLAVHRMPQIGEVSPGLWLLSGFGGQGLSTTAIGGELLARAIVEGDSTWQLFNPFGLVWAGGTAGRTVAQAASWASRGRERLEGWLARRRRGPAAMPGTAGGMVETPQFESVPQPPAAAAPEPPPIAMAEPAPMAQAELAVPPAPAVMPDDAAASANVRNPAKARRPTIRHRPAAFHKP